MELVRRHTHRMAQCLETSGIYIIVYKMCGRRGADVEPAALLYRPIVGEIRLASCSYGPFTPCPGIFY